MTLSCLGIYILYCIVVDSLSIDTLVTAWQGGRLALFTALRWRLYIFHLVTLKLTLKLSPDFIPLPPLMTTLAEASSGLSDLDSSWETNSEVASVAGTARASSAPEPPLAASASKEVVRTVRTWGEGKMLFYVAEAEYFDT